jgi:IclR family pca regulon transcriptional regulator
VPREPELELERSAVLRGRRAEIWGAVLGGRPRYSISLAIGLGILLCFSRERSILGIADMSELLGLRGRSTMHRYAATLLALGYLEQDRARRYLLAAKSADPALALLHSMPLRRAVREHARQLRDDVRCTVGVAILDEGAILYTERFPGHQRGQWAADGDAGVGARLPAPCTAAGKALLANLDLVQRERALKRLQLRRRGPAAITAKGALRSELQRVFDDGLAVSEDELAPGITAIAVPLRDERGETLAAIEITGPLGAFTGVALARQHGAALRALAQELVLPPAALVPAPAAAVLAG